ncbi:MAG: hypothetical protein ACYCSF_14445 [Acidimicrobiales bacterium]
MRARGLVELEEVVDRSQVTELIDPLMPSGGRPRQLSVRSLFVGILLAMSDQRPAHLTRVHRALVGLPEPDRSRLGVLASWGRGPHLLTYRQVEWTVRLVVGVCARPTPDGTPSELLGKVADRIVEASIPERWRDASGSYAVDWSDLETFSRPPPKKGGNCADPEASWGRRAADQPGATDELFYGYEMQSATMVPDENGTPVPELARRILVTTCSVDPPPAFVPVLADMTASGVMVSDVLADSGYAHRVAEHWSAPLRSLGAEIVTDHHPADRGPRGSFMGAIVSNGNLYCPATSPVLLGLGPLHRGATRGETEAHDLMSAELSRYKLGRITRDDQDGYHRVMCPAAMGKLRCPLRTESMALTHERPEVLAPPEHPPACCVQRTVTVPPEVHLKMGQRHDYPSKAHRISYARRTAVERTFSTLKDPASHDVNRGWCRLMGLAPIMLFLACVVVVRNDRITEAFHEREAEALTRQISGRPRLARRRRRRSLDDLVAGSAR